jgi:hypothetical protein
LPGLPLFPDFFLSRLGYGADGICPYVAYEALAKMSDDGQIYARAKQDYVDEELFFAYRKSAAKGLLKVFSKIGICTLQSYKGAQIFETVGLAENIVDRCFTGTTSRIQGADFNAIYVSWFVSVFFYIFLLLGGPFS